MQIEIKTMADIEALLIKLIKNGNPEPDEEVIEAGTVPFKDIKWFDSLSALEILTELEEETGIHVENDIFYVDLKPKKKFLSIHETASAIWSELQKGGKQHA
jgi:acyl carrier protein